MADNLHVELVSADRLVWSGEAEQIYARTTDGEIGVWSDHMPVLSVLTPTSIAVLSGGERFYVAASGGFISVSHNRISVLAEQLELGRDINPAEARQSWEDAQRGDNVHDDVVAYAEARVKAAEKSA